MEPEVSSDVMMAGEALMRFVEKEVLPLEKEHASVLGDERMLFGPDGRYCPKVLELRRHVRMRSAESGFYTMLAPQSLGGGGLGATAAVYLQGLMASAYGPERTLIHHVVIPSPFTNGLSPVLEFLGANAAEKVLPQLASGDKTLCFGLSEPDAGSDVFAIKTRAVREGDGWVISGAKQWITNSPYADYAVIFAVTNPELMTARKGGITAFLLDTASPGFKVTSVLRLMGHIGGDTGIISLDAVRVSDDYRLGEVDRGLSVAMHGVNAGRLGMAATCVGLAEWGLAATLEYARTRRTFGRMIAEHQAIQMHLANAAIDIFAAKNITTSCARHIERGHSSRGEIAIAKAYATEMLSRTMDSFIQVHGAMGLTSELRLEAGYRFARMMRIPDGTAEMQRRTIAAELLDGRLAF